MRSSLPLLSLCALACGPRPCGDAGYVTAGDALALWDVAGDGLTADLVERCGPDWGTYGLRRTDLGLTTLLLEPDPADFDFEASLEVSTYLLPSATLSFLTEHLAVGTVLGMESLGGTGLSKLHGTIDPGYTTYGLLDARVEVIEGPKVAKDTVGASAHEETWTLAWSAQLGDVQTGQVLQTWDAEDRVTIGDGTEIGDPLGPPPDWSR